MKIILGFFLMILLASAVFAQDLPIPKSPLISRLETDIADGKKNSAPDFWKFVEANGTPLIEPLPGDKKNSLVTFIWRGDSETQNVLNQSLFYPLMMVRRQLKRIGETDVWYRTDKVPNDARFTYQFSVNDPRLPIPDPYDWLKFKVPLFTDPLNNRKFFYPKDPDDPDDYDSDASLVEMPEAIKSPYLTPQQNVRKGEVELTRYKSAILANERRIWYYTPPDYSPKKKYPLVIFLDGFYYQYFIPATTILDNLIAAGKIPPVVAVFVATPIGAGIREKEYYANDSFAEFMVKELLPQIRSKYSLNPKPEETTLVGLSASAFAAGFLALKHPEKFGNVVMQSPPLWWGKEPSGEDGEWLTQQYINAGKLKVRFYFEIGEFEVFPSVRRGRPNFVHSVRHFRDILKLKGIRHLYNEFNGAHDFVCWRETLPAALTNILDKRSF